MKKIIIILVILLALFILLSFNRKKMNKLKSPVKKLVIRGCDLAGCGYFGARRTNHIHEGIDVVVTPGETVYSPISGKVRRLYVKKGNTQQTGYEIKNGELAVKLFYVNFSDKYKTGQTIKENDPLSTAQDVAKFYNSETMTPHIHVEVLINGKNVDPTPYFV